MQIESKNASLDTLAVTIRALHVSGKQMTLAVFRQLPTARERDGSSLWGVVRYTIKDEGELWLVFSHDGVLYRRAVFPGQPFADKSGLHSAQYKLKMAENEINRWGAHLKGDRLAEKEQELILLRGSVMAEQAGYEARLAADKTRTDQEKRLAQLPQLFISV